MISTTDEMRDVVYTHLYGLYSKFAMECFPYLTTELTNIISCSAMQEMIQMAQEGNLISYYERIKNNAV